jgi:amino acid permease
MTDSSSFIINSNSKLSNFDEITPASRSIYMRAFGRIEPGALRGAIFNLISSAVGAGCLALPLIFYRQGIIGTIFLLCLSFAISYVGVINIAKASDRFQIYNYSLLTENVLGRRWKLLFDIGLIVAQLGTIIGYQILIGDIIPGTLQYFNINFDTKTERYIIMIATNVLIVTPLGLLKTLTELRFASLVTMAALSYILLVIIVEFKFYAESNVYENNVNWFNLDLSIITSMNVCLYSFSCHMNVIQVYDELHNRNLKRMQKVAFRSLLLLLVPYILLGLFGYLSTLNNTPEIFLNRAKAPSISNDWVMTSCKFLMMIILIIGLSFNIPSARSVVIKNIFRVNDTPSTLL